jgi:myo-inositol 2-dehydrogenase/D-chiro-inositol 1-dehydrogenase/scyllo-inositol 2-dehydrogenase (NAD+)
VVQKAVESWRTRFKDAYVCELEHFVQCVRTEKQPRVTGLDGLKALEAVVAANRSIEEGVPVEISV